MPSEGASDGADSSGAGASAGGVSEPMLDVSDDSAAGGEAGASAIGAEAGVLASCTPSVLVGFT